MPRTPPPRVRVLVVDDHSAWVEVVTTMLALDKRIEVVGSAADGAVAVRLATATRPDVVLMDVNLPRLDGVEATRRILARLPRARVLVVSSSTDPEDMVRAEQAGACGYIVKGASPEELIERVLVSSAPRPSRTPPLARAVALSAA